MNGRRAKYERDGEVEVLERERERERKKKEEKRRSLSLTRSGLVSLRLHLSLPDGIVDLRLLTSRRLQRLSRIS